MAFGGMPNHNDQHIAPWICFSLALGGFVASQRTIGHHGMGLSSHNFFAQSFFARSTHLGSRVMIQIDACVTSLNTTWLSSNASKGWTARHGLLESKLFGAFMTWCLGITIVHHTLTSWNYAWAYQLCFVYRWRVTLYISTACQSTQKQTLKAIVHHTLTSWNDAWA